MHCAKLFINSPCVEVIGALKVVSFLKTAARSAVYLVTIK